MTLVCRSAAPRAPDLQQLIRCGRLTLRPSLQVALENDQPEAAFDIYRKAGMKIEALNTLVERIEDFDRAHEYATKVDDPATWSTLGHAQLARGFVNDAIGSYLLAKDSSKCGPAALARRVRSGT